MNINEKYNIKSKDIKSLSEKIKNTSIETKQKIEDLIEILKLIFNNNEKINELNYTEIHNKVCNIVREKSGEKLYKKLEEMMNQLLTDKIKNITNIMNLEHYLKTVLDLFDEIGNKAKLIKKLLFYYETNFISKSEKNENFILFTIRIFKRVLKHQKYFNNLKDYILEQVSCERSKINKFLVLSMFLITLAQEMNYNLIKP